MNKEEAWKTLIEHLQNDKFIIPTDFLKDLKQILRKNLKGQEKTFFNLLVKQLGYILSLDEYSVSQANSNEILKYCTDFKCYSLHIFSSRFNVRILGTYIDEKFIFLVAFYEKSNKKATDYSKNIELAKTRLNEFKGEDTYE